MSSAVSQSPPAPVLGPSLDRLSLGLVALSVLALSLHKITGYDVWWQLATGAWILEQGFPDLDPFSYGFPGRDWVELRWLHCVGVHVLAQRFGLNGLIAAKCLLLLATFGLLRGVARSRHLWVTALALLATLCLAYDRFRVRPELVSYLLMAVFLLCLQRYKQGAGARWLAPLPVLQIVWSNVHTLAVLGPVLIGTLAACEALQARFPSLLPADAHPVRGRRLAQLALATAATVGALFLNPWGVQGVLFPFTLLWQIGATDLAILIGEFRSPFRDARPSLFFLAYFAVMPLSAASFALNRQLVLVRLAWWAGFLFLSVLSNRNVALFGIVAGVVLALNLRDWLDSGEEGPLQRWLPWASRALVLGLAAVLPVAAASGHFWRLDGRNQRFGFGVVEWMFPIRAMAFVREHELPTPVLASLGDGGYLIHEGGPGSVYVDGRLEVYGARDAAAAIRTLQDGPGFLGLLERHDIGTAVLRDPLLRDALDALDASPDWAPVYFDAGHAVYLKRSRATRERFEALAFDWQQPVRRSAKPPPFDAPPDWSASWLPRAPDVTGLVRLGYFLLGRRSPELAREVLEEALRQRPDDRAARELLELTSAAASAGELPSGTDRRFRGRGGFDTLDSD